MRITQNGPRPMMIHCRIRPDSIELLEGAILRDVLIEGGTLTGAERNVTVINCKVVQT